jgi:hypothetical protein
MKVSPRRPSRPRERTQLRQLRTVHPVDQRSSANVRARRDDCRKHGSQPLIGRRARAIPRHDRSVRSSPAERGQVKPHSRSTTSHTARSRPPRRRREPPWRRVKQDRPQRHAHRIDPVRRIRARTTASAAQHRQPQRGDHRDQPTAPRLPSTNAFGNHARMRTKAIFHVATSSARLPSATSKTRCTPPLQVEQLDDRRARTGPPRRVRVRRAR